MDSHFLIPDIYDYGEMTNPFDTIEFARPGASGKAIDIESGVVVHIYGSIENIFGDIS